jgi:hypothetical protein
MCVSSVPLRQAYPPYSNFRVDVYICTFTVPVQDPKCGSKVIKNPNIVNSNRISFYRKEVNYPIHE